MVAKTEVKNSESTKVINSEPINQLIQQLHQKSRNNWEKKGKYPFKDLVETIKKTRTKKTKLATKLGPVNATLPKHVKEYIYYKTFDMSKLSPIALARYKTYCEAVQINAVLGYKIDYLVENFFELLDKSKSDLSEIECKALDALNLLAKEKSQ